MPHLHAIISTHTPRHLRRTIMGVVHQAPPADRIIISCDNDSDEILEVVRASSEEFNVPLTLVRRPFTGAGRSGQVRNNAVRALLADRGGNGDAPARLVFFDGDCFPVMDTLKLHHHYGRRRDALVLGYRVDLTQEQTHAFSEEAARQGRLPIQPTAEQERLLARRQRRYQRQKLVRGLGLGKPHKPKLLSANFSVPLSGYVAINGFDETYEGYGQEDDDFGRRWYRAIGLPAIAVSKMLVFHLYHPTRAPGDWHQSPNAARFAAGARGPARCIRGVDSPLEQGPLNIQHFNPR